MSARTPTSPLTISGTLPAIPGPESLPRGRGPLLNRNFALLATGQAISNLGDFVYSTTLLVWAYALTHSAAAVSGILIAQYTPVFLLGPIAGVFVDRWNRRTTMIVSDLSRTLIAMLPFIAPLALRLPAIYASVFLIAAFGQLFMPARSGALQVVVHPDDQTQAASIGQVTLAMSFIIGPAIATPLYFAVGALVACSINAASYLVSALCVARMRATREQLHPYAYAKHEAGALGPVLREMGDGFRFVATTRVLLIVSILALIAMFGGGALNALDIFFVTRNLHTSAEYYGFMTAVSGAGTLIGAIVLSIFAKRIQPRYILTGSVFWLGAGIVLYSFQSWFIVALIINFLLSLPQGGIDIGFAPLLLNSTPQKLIGRVSSVVNTATYASSLASAALAAYVGGFVPVGIIFAVGGALIAIAGVFGFLALPKQAAAPTEQQA
jgi:predicted MFS family arabinose efflux permease